MASISLATSVPVRTRPRISRDHTVSTKLTEEEFAQVEKLAEGRGQWVSEWVRDALLATVREHESQQQLTLFTEVQALRLLLINTLEPLLRGEMMTAEQFKEVLRFVRSSKKTAAQEMLASYSEAAEERI